MPHINEMKGPSKYLSKEDVGRGALVTVKSIEPRMVDGEHGKENKWLMFFVEDLKPLILNSTNIQLTARICGSENTDDWPNHKLVLYTDPNVSYAGKLVGGIRIRAPKQQAINPALSTSQNIEAYKQQKQTIAAAAAKWTQSHAMPSAAPPQEEMLEGDEIPF